MTPGDRAHDGPSPYRPPLSTRDLRARLLVRGGLWCAVDVVESTGSTNADLRASALAGAAEGTVLLAEEQVQGRGRLDRRWQAPARSSLALSFLLRPPPEAPTSWGWLPLMTGLAVAEAVASVSTLDAGVKWPNDVLVGDAKVAGILAEHVTTPGGPAVVVGVGLNVSQTPEELPVPTAGSLLGLGADVDRAELAVAVLERIAERYQGWRIDPDALRGDYLGRCTTLGRPVAAQLPAALEVSGTAVDVDSTGRLVLDVGGERVEVAVADVVHLRTHRS